MKVNMIKEIEIKNIKGIKAKKLELDLIPNKPSILVAPNGFGKSSLAIGFKSMNRDRINLDKSNYPKDIEKNLPYICIKYKRGNEIVKLEATKDKNTISNEFAWFVINNSTKPKGIGSIYGKATAILDIDNIEILKIPENVQFKYSYQQFKNKFGNNGKVLPNIKKILSNSLLIEELSENYDKFDKVLGKRMVENVEKIISEINKQRGNKYQIIEWIKNNKLEQLKKNKYLSNISSIIYKHSNNLLSEIKSYLAALQLIWLYEDDKGRFKKVCKYNNYKKYKKKINGIIIRLDTTERNIKAKEKRGKLVVEFPNANEISNGERDILTFVSMLFVVEEKLKKDKNILIIDEVFDYLDDANLMFAQYYITKLIKGYKDKGKEIYPLILTHLNPYYFKNFIFSDQKVYYLEKSKTKIGNDMRRLLEIRRNTKGNMKDEISKYLLHYHPDENKREETLKKLNIKIDINEYMNSELKKYLDNRDYDPIAVCGVLRIKIEEVTYKKINNEKDKTEFLNINTTRKKLNEAKNYGVEIPEIYYLLGIVYNEGMHWNEKRDNISPIVSKLNNRFVKKMIQDVIEKIMVEI